MSFVMQYSSTKRRIYNLGSASLFGENVTDQHVNKCLTSVNQRPRVYAQKVIDYNVNTTHATRTRKRNRKNRFVPRSPRRPFCLRLPSGRWPTHGRYRTAGGGEWPRPPDYGRHASRSLGKFASFGSVEWLTRRRERTTPCVATSSSQSVTDKSVILYQTTTAPCVPPESPSFGFMLSKNPKKTRQQLSKLCRKTLDERPRKREKRSTYDFHDSCLPADFTRTLIGGKSKKKNLKNFSHPTCATCIRFDLDRCAPKVSSMWVTRLQRVFRRFQSTKAIYRHLPPKRIGIRPVRGPSDGGWIFVFKTVFARVGKNAKHYRPYVYDYLFIFVVV